MYVADWTTAANRAGPAITASAADDMRLLRLLLQRSSLLRVKLRALHRCREEEEEEKAAAADVLLK